MNSPIPVVTVKDSTEVSCPSGVMVDGELHTGMKYSLMRFNYVIGSFFVYWE